MTQLTKKQRTKVLVWDVLYDIAGSIFFALGIHCFVGPSNIAPGGMSGIALMINYLSGLPVGTMTFILNIPIMLLGYKYLGKQLTWKTLKTLIISTVLLDFVVAPFVPVYAGDRLLGSIFGGVLMGVGLALVFLRGSTTAGTDILSYLLQMKRPHMPIGRAILIVDCVILVASMAVFRDLESGLFGMISLFCCTKVIDSIIYGVEKGSQVTIVSEHTQEIADRVMELLDRGVTLLDGKGGYTRKPTEVLICVVNKRQFAQLKSIIYEIDPDAFVFAAETEEILGEGFKPIQNERK